MIYMDNAATTHMSEAVKHEIVKYMDDFGNPSSIYQIGKNNKEIIKQTKELIANYINAKPQEIYFTSCGSESDNWALKGFCLDKKYGHIITSSIEHKAILNTCHWLETLGFRVTYISPDERGWISPTKVKEAICDDTIICSIMYANNEIGTIEPVHEIGKICHEHGVVFHTDAVQAFQYCDIDVSSDIDMMSVSGHKFHAPKGIGFLYVKNNIELKPIIHGGGQEYGMRAGTENILGIIGMKVALGEINHNNNSLYFTRDNIIHRILTEIDNSFLNGMSINRLPNNINICIRGANASQIVGLLDNYGIYISSGSACNSKDSTPSHVLKAIGLSDYDANCSIRITISEDNSDEEIDYMIDKLKFIVNMIR